MKQKIIFWDWTGTLADESKLDENVCKSMEMEIARKNNISFEEAENKYKSYLKKLENTWQWHDHTQHGKALGVDWKLHQMSNLKKLVLLPYAKEILEISQAMIY